MPILMASEWIPILIATNSSYPIGAAHFSMSTHLIILSGRPGLRRLEILLTGRQILNWVMGSIRTFHALWTSRLHLQWRMHSMNTPEVIQEWRKFMDYFH